MKISRALIFAATLAVSSFAMSQTLPPPSFAGQNYWFGPGPATYSNTSASQTRGGFSEMYSTNGIWLGGVGGGPAFYNSQPSGAGFESTFTMTSDLTVEPYVYIDGYFGTQASVNGFTGQNVAVGTSRFFVLHNVPVDVTFSGFTDFVLSGQPSILSHFSFQLYNYSTAALLRAGGLNGDDGLVYTTTLDNALDGGVMQVDCNRLALLNTNVAAGTYSANGQVTITAF